MQQKTLSIFTNKTTAQAEIYTTEAQQLCRITQKVIGPYPFGIPMGHPNTVTEKADSGLYGKPGYTTESEGGGALAEEALTATRLPRIYNRNAPFRSMKQRRTCRGELAFLQDNHNRTGCIVVDVQYWGNNRWRTVIYSEKPEDELRMGRT